MIHAKSAVRSIDVSAVVTRADGTIEDLGVIAKYRRYRWVWWVIALVLAALFALAFPAAHGLHFLLGATLLVNGGRAIITNLVSGLGGTVPKYVAWGTGAGTTGATDTTLFTESAEARTSGTVTQQTTSTSNDTLQVVGAITATAVRVITNAGLFDQLAVGGNLFVKSDFTSITLASGEIITFTFKISFS